MLGHQFGDDECKQHVGVVRAGAHHFDGRVNEPSASGSARRRLRRGRAAHNVDVSETNDGSLGNQYAQGLTHCFSISSKIEGDLACSHAACMERKLLQNHSLETSVHRGVSRMRRV